MTLNLNFSGQHFSGQPNKRVDSQSAIMAQKAMAQFQPQLAPKPTFQERYQPLESYKILRDVHRSSQQLTDSRLAFFDDRMKWLGGLLIAALGIASTRRRLFGLGEVLGFLGFFSAMAATPKVLNALVWLKTGARFRREYISSEGGRKPFQDPQYLPLHLLPDSEIDSVGKRMKIPRGIVHRRSVIEEKIRQISSQAMTFWMLVAGAVTPVVASGVGHVLEKPATRGLGRLTQRWHQWQLKRAIQQGKPAKIEAHLKKSLNEIMGTAPDSQLSRWWLSFGDGMVKESGLMKRFGGSKVNQWDKTRWDEQLVDFFDGLKNKPEQRNQMLAYLKTLEEKQLKDLKNAADTLVAQLKTGQEPHHQWIDTQVLKAKAAVQRYRRLIQELPDLDKTEIKQLLETSISHFHEWLKPDGIEAGRIMEIAAGDTSTLTRIRELIAQKADDNARELLGPQLTRHLHEGIARRSATKLWRTRVFGYIGGATALVTLGFMALVGRDFKIKTKGLSREQVLEKYNTDGSFEKHQAELKTLHQQMAQLPIRPETQHPAQLKNLFQQNKAVIYALNVRTFGAVDRNGDGKISPELGESGTFLSMIPRLDELKARGVNTLHLLPITPIGRLKHKGDAGSLYAPSSMTALNAEFDDPKNPMNVYDEFRFFVQEAHKRGIYIMADVPSCASVDLAITRPDLIDSDRYGRTLTPPNWEEIVMMKSDAVVKDYFQQYFTMMADKLGVDGFRVDVARARPPEFWRDLISQYPNHAWLAETYVTETQTPIKNLPRDIPGPILKAGFDSIYSQMHILHDMPTATSYFQYLNEVNPLLKNAGRDGKSIIGSVLTHDDEKTLMKRGGQLYSNFALGLMTLQPRTNMYVVDGELTGFPERIDIFNFGKPPVGEHPQTGDFFKQMLDLRERYQPVLNQGQFMPLWVNGNKDDKIIAFLRQYGDKTLLVIGNKDMNARQKGQIAVPYLKADQILNNLAPEYGGETTQRVVNIPGSDPFIDVSLAPGVLKVFEVTLPRMLGRGL